MSDDKRSIVMTAEQWAKLTSMLEFSDGKVRFPADVWEESGSGVHERKRRKKTKIDAALKARVAELVEKNPQITHREIETILGAPQGFIRKNQGVAEVVRATRVYKLPRVSDGGGYGE